MAIEPGTRIGPYQVVSAIGEGGMGEVYRARDARLDRDVALKILPQSFASDPDRLMRFEREARTLAALNHPNIAQVYGLETAGQTQAIVLELVDGPTLDEAIREKFDRRGQRSDVLEWALPIARQIADALEAAHEQGIVHRDLKPANVKVRADGTVKVLDFGLAKAAESAASAPGAPAVADSPTMTSPALTAMGVILGTAAYMSPEQARGRPVDRRADVWAFGVVLYEMLAGRRAFDGDDISITLAGVLKEDVDWDALPADLPAPIRRLLRRCLEKDPRRRLSAIGDARLELDERDEAGPPAPGPGAADAPRSTTRLAAGAAALVALTAAVTLWLSGALATPSVSTARLTVLAPEGLSLIRDSANVALSPDGRRLAFVTGSSESDARLQIRTLDDLVPREVEDSAGATLPFWSPDSSRVAFFAGGRLMTVPAAGGRPRAIAAAPDARGGTWNADGVILFAPNGAGPLSRVSENGGAVTETTALASDPAETGHRFPAFLPDGRHFTFATLPSKAGLYDIYVAALDSDDRAFLLSAETAPVFAEPGYLIYTRTGMLVAQPFDPARRSLTGEAIPLGDMPGEMNMQYAAGIASSVTTTGSLAYLSAGRERSRLVWLDQTGREIETTEVPPGPYMSASISPGGDRAVLMNLAAPNTNVVLADLERGGLTPVTTREVGWNGLPVWSPAGDRVAFSSDKAGPVDLYVRSVDLADEEPLFQSPGLFKHAMSWTTGGLVFSDLTTETATDLWTIQPDGDRTPRLFLRTPGEDPFGAISPDGRWMAYITDQSGTLDAYVQAFPGPGAAHRITTNGTLDWGLWWREDGRQLLVLGADLQLLLVDVQTSPGFVASAPRAVGRLSFPPVGLNSIQATPDLRRLLAIVPDRTEGRRSITVVEHWPSLVGPRTP